MKEEKVSRRQVSVTTKGRPSKSKKRVWWLRQQHRDAGMTKNQRIFITKNRWRGACRRLPPRVSVCAHRFGPSTSRWFVGTRAIISADLAGMCVEVRNALLPCRVQVAPSATLSYGHGQRRGKEPEGKNRRKRKGQSGGDRGWCLWAIP